MRFLFFDRVIAATKGEKMIAVKNVALSEEFFPSHFPRRAVMPASILAESMAQVSGWLVNLSCEFRVSALMCIVREASFEGLVDAGHEIHMEARLLELEKRSAWVTCRAHVQDEEVASMSRIMFALIPIPTEAEIEHERQRFAYFSGGFQLDVAGGAVGTEAAS